MEQKTEPPLVTPKPAPLPSPLTARDVNRVLVKNSRKILECGEKFPELTIQLPMRFNEQ
ncbi:hypothetical protein KYC5002_22220 [Archangium violaceum]|uniref:hypothetical protein n=1 Tax=Archangium violaceum TaxID=83451 RepID=UPI002B2D3FA8|nr:hypothetical protein KYC5002_22220 [Archangium gephyra]